MFKIDKGAHFFNCDFQVHTPRDRNWTGAKFGVNSDEIDSLTEEQKQQILSERSQFAKEYLSKVRDSGLNAIAITDHHDVIFAKIIRKIAQEENKQFIMQMQYDKCVTVFPGIELTLSNPVSQCLLIFDANFPDNDLDSVINFLGFNPSNEFDKNTTVTQRISQEIINDLRHLHKKLDELGYCKGKYIIIPNINKSGEFTILRQGFNEHYRKMPCVGGYVDKAISTDSGYQNKLNGGDVNYGNKPIGILCTSDNRFEDGRLFGQYSTWVKWEEATGEALRQACLARESRLSQTKPDLPQIFINRLEVTNCKYLGSFVIEFNNQYNALIGGRGTGKSTILEYIRWGLCDQTDLTDDLEEKSDLEKRRKVLIEKTLVPFGGEVRITFSLNGIIHIVKRNSASKEILLKIGEDNFEPAKEEEIRRILPIQAYSQKQLSNIGVRTEELKRFIQQPINNQLSTLKFQVLDNSKKTRSAYSNYLRKKEIQNEIDQFNLEVKSLKDQVGNLRKLLNGISEDDQNIISKKQSYDNEQNLIKHSMLEFSVVLDRVNGLIDALKGYPEPISFDQELENVELMKSIDDAKKKKFDEIKEIANKLQSLFGEENQKEINELVKQWEGIKNEFQAQYEAVKAKASSNQNQLAEIQRIEKKLQELSSSLTDRTSVIKDIGNPDEEFNILRGEWFSLYQQKLTLLVEQSQMLSQLSKECIKAEYSRSLDTEQIKKQIVVAFQGTRIREDKVQNLCDYIKTNDNSLTIWNQILNELKSLAELKVSDEKKVEMPATPILDACDYNASNKERIVALLTPDKWLEIALTEMEFNPEFRYTTNSQMGDSIPFSEASAGQQATALLTVLLNQPGNPLVIDQPEDDIDNRAIDAIIRNIWDAKKTRQLIFTSHNANIVVNGDAELVICCDYLEAGNVTRGTVKAEGAIDSKNIKDEITSIMEGGEKAFRLRKEKYGF